jgi:hypothetical protein
MHLTHPRVFLPLLVLAAIFSACAAGTSDVQTPPPLPPGTYNYQLAAANLDSPDTSEQYVLWLEMRDTTWQAVRLTSWTRVGGVDSLFFAGRLATFPDSIVRVFLSIEPATLSSTPSARIMSGAFSNVSNSAKLHSTDSNGTDDYSGVGGSVLFTTKSSDTNRAKQEFYFMRDSSGVFIASLAGLPRPNPGWVYGIWAEDTNFYPKRKIFYGYFTSAVGADSKPNTAAFPFPGGYNPAPLNDPGAEIEITLDAEFLDRGNHPTGPSSMPVLWAPLKRFIHFDESLKLENVWKANAVSGSFSLSR